MKQKSIDLSKISEEELLELRICDLPIAIEGTWLQERINEAYLNLDRKGIRLKPPCYLADEWLAPDEEPIVGIPFFLAHPTLMKLERKMMLDVEGGTKHWCMQLLRHEMGHAINYAYRLYKRRRWQKIFGKFSQEYADTYRFRPYSRNFVRHLEDYYAQYHPDEDFAETFAVWLTPGLDWQNRYKGWKAIRKLQYVDEVINEIKNKEPVVTCGQKYWEASRLRIKLKNFYKKKRYSYAEQFPDFHDANLHRIFSERSEGVEGVAWAHEVLRKNRRSVLSEVSTWTGEKKYVIDGLLKTLIERAKELKLIVADSETLALMRISTYVTTLIMNYLHTGQFRK